MLTEHIKSALRSLSRQKGFAVLNFLGLGTALTIALLTGLMLIHERSFDHFHRDSEHLFRVVTQMDNPNGESEKFAEVATILPATVRAEMPELGQYTEVIFYEDNIVRLSPAYFFKEKNLVFADTNFFELFSFGTGIGNAKATLSQPNQVLLTQTTAAKYFPNENPLGKTINIEVEQCPVKVFSVAGVIPDAPANTHLPFTMLISAASLKPNPEAGWGWFSGGQYLYIKPAQNTSLDQISGRISAMANARKEKDDISTYTYRLQPLADIHSNMDYARGNATYTVDFERFYWLGAISLFLLLIAAVNYINLATAIAQRKAREVGVRKTLGAGRWQLAKQFWFETFLLVAGAAVFSIFAANALLPILNQFLDRNFEANWLSGQMLGFTTALCLLTTLAAGAYPAFVMAGFSPTQAFRDRLYGKNPQSSLTLRRSLVTFQFVVAQVFIAAVIIAAMQMRYIKSKPLGFNTAGIVNLHLADPKPEQVSALRTELANIPGVISTSYCIGAPTSRSGFTTRFNLPARYEQQKLEIAIKVADPQYLETYGLKLKAGRFLNQSDEAQSAESLPEEQRQYACVLNETAVKALGFRTPEEALGVTVRLGANNMNPTIVGVVYDFHTRSLREGLQSVGILPYHNFKFTLGARLEPSAANTATLAKMEAAWKKICPNDLFTAAFLDDFLVTLYHDEQRVFAVFKLVALLALLINALGLIGLTVFIVGAKTKEIGIRKVLGASVTSITGLLTRDFLKLAVIALVLATPLAWWAMGLWLANFAYRIEIQWWMFVGAGLSAIAVACLTVGFQAIRAALANPVKSLRSE